MIFHNKYFACQTFPCSVAHFGAQGPGGTAQAAAQSPGWDVGGAAEVAATVPLLETAPGKKLRKKKCPINIYIYVFFLWNYGKVWDPTWISLFPSIIHMCIYIIIYIYPPSFRLFSLAQNQQHHQLYMNPAQNPKDQIEKVWKGHPAQIKLR